MSALAPLELSFLRDVGFSKWDPIGLVAEGEAWDHQPFADEYDGYLLQAAGGLRRDWSLQQAVFYLLHIESAHMRLGERPDSRSRAQATSEAIRSYLDSVDASR